MIDLGYFEFRLAEADWDRFQRADEWFTFDVTALYDSTATELSKLEKAMGGYRVAKMVMELGNLAADAYRAAFFVGRRQAGIRESWAAFDPRVLAAEMREPAEPQGDDADPPDSAESGQPQSSTDTPPVESVPE